MDITQISVFLENRPNRLQQVLKVLADADCSGARQINIDYMYGFADQYGKRSIFIFRFEDTERAKLALAEEGYTIMKRADILGE